MSLPQHYDEVPMSWVGDWAGCRACLTPQREAVYDASSERRLSYAQLNERANRLGAFLLGELGMKKGDVICFISRNRLEPLDLYFACGKTGVILAPLSYRLAKPELDDLLQRIRPNALFVEDHFAAKTESLSLPKSVRRTILFGGEDSQYEREVLRTQPGEVNRPLAMNDIFLYLHTGGTTATPKLCLVTHRQMIWNSFDLLATGSAFSGGRELVTFPLFHIGGWNTVTPLFHIGGTVVLMREFDPDLALELIDREKITHFGGVEAMLRFMIASPKFESTTFESVQYINSAGAPCAAEVMRAFWEKGVPLTQCYGLTEAGPSNFIFLPDPASVPPDEVQAHAESIGFPMFHCDARLIARETGLPVKPGEIGELCFRGPHSFEGYLDDPERTAQVVDKEGWVHSGDLACRDEQGFFQIIGRADNLIISGGENISPEEIEQALLKHPAVAQAAVTGVPDARWGQVPLAAVVLQPGAQVSESELKAFCRQQLAKFKVPKYWRFSAALPLTGAGKVDRNALKTLFSER